MSLNSWLASLTGLSNRPGRKAAKRKSRQRVLQSPAAEMLESRALLSAGSLDASFGNAGIVTTNFIEVTNLPGWSDSASSVAMQDDGKIVVAGTIEPNGGPEGAISRYNVDGSLDNTFSSDGKISDPEFNIINDVAIQPDGRIVVVGRAYPMNGAAGNFAIGRFNADGSRDTTFGTNGIVITNPGAYDTAYSVALLNGGKILVTGQSGQPGPEQPYGFTLQQFNPNGTVDTSFGDLGQVRTFYSTAEIGGGYAHIGNVGARDLAVQPDGKIIVAGHSLNGDASNGYQNGFAVVRYNPDGSLDTSFDTDGRAYTNLGAGQHHVTSLALQGDGKMIVGGFSLKLSPVVEADFTILRYNTDGSLDTTFDGDGKLILDYGGTDDYVNDVKVQSDGAILVTGSVGDSLAVARFNSNGSPDTTFGTNGLVTTAIQASASGSEVVIQPDGAIVVAGTVNNGNGNRFLNRDFVVVRYNADVAVDTTTTVTAADATYDGNAHGATAVVDPGVATGLTTFYYTGTGGYDSSDAPTNAGTYHVVATFTSDSAAYNSSSGEADFTIAKAASSVVTVGAGPFSYDGTTHTGGSGLVSGAGIITGSATLTYSGDQINAGTYYVTAHYAGDANHEASDGDTVAILINKATLTGVATTQSALNLAKQGSLVFAINNLSGLQGSDSLADVLSTASFSLKIGVNTYSFAPSVSIDTHGTASTSDDTLLVSYSLKNGGSAGQLAADLQALNVSDGTNSTSASNASVQAIWVCMSGTNYNFMDDALTKLFSSAK